MGFEDHSEDHAEVARRSDDPSDEDMKFEDNDDFSMEDLMALADMLNLEDEGEGDESENNVARRSDDASEAAPAEENSEFSLEDLMALADMLDLEGDDEFEDDEDLEDEEDPEDFDENELQAAFENY